MTAKIKRKSLQAPVKEDDPVIYAEPVVETISPAEAAPLLLPWLTLETVLYTFLFILALGVRLWSLDLYPLSEAEAAQSWPALQLYQGELPTAQAYSPLLLSVNALTFFLLGVNDVTARLAPVLLGSLMVLLPVTLRRSLGPRICLLATALLTFSPLVLFASRSLNSEVALAAGTLMIVSGFFNWAENGQQRWLLLLMAGLAVSLTSGPMLVSVLIVFGGLILIKFSSFKALWLKGFNQTEDQAEEVNSTPEPDDLTPKITPADGHTPAQNLSSQSPVSNLQSPFPRQVGFFFLAALIALATAGLFNMGGLGVLSGFLPDWFSRFGWQGRPDAGFNAVFLLTVYEPLLVLAGLAGLAYAILEKDLLKQILGGWFAGLIILDVVMIGRPNGNVILPLIPLAFLAAMALAELWHSLEQAGSWGNEGLLLVVGVVISVFCYIGLTGWLERTCNPDDAICQYAWLQPIAALGLFFIIAVFFGFMANPGVAGRGIALAGVALGLMAAVSIGWRLNFGPLMDLAYQPVAGIPASTGLVALTDTLTRQSAERTGGQQTAIDTTLAGVTNMALRWRLRNAEQLTVVNSVAEAPPTMAIITPVNVELGIGQPYLGQKFTLDALWSPVGLEAKPLIKWLIYRHADQPPQGNEVILWLQPELN